MKVPLEISDRNVEKTDASPIVQRKACGMASLREAAPTLRASRRTPAKKQATRSIWQRASQPVGDIA